MDTEKTPWLKAEFSASALDEHEAKEKLYALARATGSVEKEKLLKEAVEARSQKHEAEMRKNLFIYHAATPGVKGLCASAVLSKKEKIYALVAYREKNYFCLKRLAALLEALLNLSGGGEEEKRPKEPINSSDEFTAYLEGFFNSSGVSIFDAEPSEIS